MKKSSRIYLTVTNKDKEKIEEMREFFDVNFSALFRETIIKKYSQLKRRAKDNL